MIFYSLILIDKWLLNWHLCVCYNIDTYYAYYNLKSLYFDNYCWHSWSYNVKIKYDLNSNFAIYSNTFASFKTLSTKPPFPRSDNHVLSTIHSLMALLNPSTTCVNIGTSIASVNSPERRNCSASEIQISVLFGPHICIVLASSTPYYKHVSNTQTFAACCSLLCFFK